MSHLNNIGRETAPVLTLDNGNERVLVLAHLFVPPWRKNLVFGLSIHPHALQFQGLVGKRYRD